MKKILIANRGEIAVRIIRTAKEMGIKTVAVHSEVDAESLFVKLADESVCIGKNRAKDSYLNMMSIMSACELTGADAVHPGYGFLSENSEFAEVVAKCGLKFIGPSAESMRVLGNKVEARALAQKSDVPLLPGTGVITGVEEAKKFAASTDYPILIKASAGGGGRGMRVAHAAKDLEQTIVSAQSEAQTAFACSDVFLEKFITKPRHVEIQIIADSHGNTYYFGERECSLQRKHQKITEEAPASYLADKMRTKMGEVACRLAREAKYEGLGTVEFLLDENDKFYFMEMNSRIQVEHPVTEEVFGVDLVELQLKIAAGEKLKLVQKDLKPQGHSIECRINAEDPQSFIPSPGLITAYHCPGGRGVRVDSFVYAGYKVPPFYDSMIAKLIVIGRDREHARKKMLRALGEYVVEGIKTNIPLHVKILNSADFKNSRHYTRWIEEKFLK